MRGCAAHPDQLAYVRESRVVGGPADGCRAIDLAPYKGIEARVLPDRGLDLGRVSFGGVPLSWTSAVGECAPPGVGGAGTEWLDSFGGGLLATCGLRNVGLPSEGFGMHGAIANRRALDVSVRRREDGEGQTEIEVRGVVREVLGVESCLTLERRIVLAAGEPSLRVEDVTRNDGSRTEPAPILYHLNFGYPLVAPGTEVELDATRTTTREGTVEGVTGDWRLIGPPAAVEPLILEHELASAGATVRNRELGLAVELSWDPESLPRLHQWLDRAPGVYVLALEPANCSLMGREFDRRQGRLPVLEPGQGRSTGIQLRIGS